MILVNIIFWVVAFLALIISIVIFVKKIWLPYSKFLVLLIAFYIFLNFLSLFSLPDWINNIGFGFAFLIFPILEKIGIRFAMFIPFTFFFIFVLLYWETTDSSTLFGLTFGYFAVIINNEMVIRGNKKKLERARSNETNAS